jgi:flagellar hook protein FlgE
MYSGISGMKVNQTKLDVIGNNITNVNTTGFKSSRAKFSDLLSQNSSNAMAPSVNKGGTNAKQVGLGVQLASIDKIMTQGSMQTTNRALDVAIDGDGYFVVGAGPVIDGDNTIQVSQRVGVHGISEQSLQNSGTELNYTRDGGFTVDSDGNLLTTSGYRVMGYSLTNDDNAQAATSVPPTAVEAGDFRFAFGPGTQLNGYSVVLGNVGPGTSTSCNVDRSGKKIIINGDFSKTGNLTAEQIQKAVNDGLTAAEISQSITIGGTGTTIDGIEAVPISGGTDATAPEKVSVGGFTINFEKSSKLNDYTFEIGSISGGSTGQPIEVKVDGTNKKVIINGDFVNNNVKAKPLEDLLNSELANKLQTGGANLIRSVTGNAMSLGVIQDPTGTSSVSVAPGITTDIAGTNPVTSGGGFLAGFEVQTTGKGDSLNKYSLNIKSTSTTGGVNINVDTSGSIAITGNVASINTATLPLATLEAQITSALSNKGITDVGLKITSGNYVAGNEVNTAYITGGKDQVSAKASGVSVGGFTISIPGPDDLVNGGVASNSFDNLEFVIVDANYTGSDVVNVEYDTTSTPKKVKISGDFTSGSGVSASGLQIELRNKLSAILGTAASTNKLVVSGTSKMYTGFTSEKISGGLDDKNPDSLENVLGSMKFDVTGGAALNGYKIQIGTISPDTKLSAKVDTTSKTITVSGDFVTQNAIKGDDIVREINKSLRATGSMGGIKLVTGIPLPISKSYAVSENANGGTSVQSLGSDGGVYYVNASALKSLKIPEKVRIAGTDTELKVKTYAIDGEGIINATLSDGRVAALGQIARASFRNPEGLTTVGDNIVSKSVNSGEPVIMSGTGTLGDDNSKGYGTCRQGYLEMSNVDLAEQFTDMIVTTKAFQASGKMISTGDDILTDIINLKR